jgi:hypothetical protein
MVDLMAWAGYFMIIYPAEALIYALGRRKEKISHREKREKLKGNRNENNLPYRGY